MKKTIFLSTIIFLVISIGLNVFLLTERIKPKEVKNALPASAAPSNPNPAVPEEENQEGIFLRHPIEQAYEEAIKSAGTTFEMSQTNLLFGDQWKAEMENYHTLLYDALKDDRKHWLSSSQSTWEAYSKDMEELSWQAADQRCHGGSIMTVIESDIYRNRYRMRAMELKKIYEALTFDH